MSFGTFYKVEDHVSTLLEGKVTKSDWYEILDLIDIQNHESLDAEESIPAWILALRNEDSAVHLLFQGEMKAKEDEFDHPDVVFLSNKMITKVVYEFEIKTKSYYQELLDHIGCTADFWLFEPMHAFLKEAALNQKAIIILWDN